MYLSAGTENSFQANETDTGGIQWFKYMMKVVIVITTVALFSIGSFAIYLGMCLQINQNAKRSTESIYDFNSEEHWEFNKVSYNFRAKIKLEGVGV